MRSWKIATLNSHGIERYVSYIIEYGFRRWGFDLRAFHRLSSEGKFSGEDEEVRLGWRFYREIAKQMEA
jgi:hypothetical protein